MFKLQYAALSHPGVVREKNEDNFYIDGKWKEVVEEQCCSAEGIMEQNTLLASVCDGMGGRALGECASLLAVETMAEYEQRIEEGLAPMFRFEPMYYIDEANRRICVEMKKQRKSMGATLAVLEFAQDTVVAGNLGDSRIYQLRDSMLTKISTDHTVMERMLRAGQITQEEATVHPMRHRITQHLGIEPEDMVLAPAMTEPISLKHQDRYLICSDGLTDMLTENRITELLKEELSLTEISRNLVQAAVDAGGKDNITVVLIEVNGEKEKFSLKEGLRKWKEKKQARIKLCKEC